MCTVQIYLLGGEQRAAQYMVEFLRGQVRTVFRVFFLKKSVLFVLLHAFVWYLEGSSYGNSVLVKLSPSVLAIDSASMLCVGSVVGLLTVA